MEPDDPELRPRRSALYVPAANERALAKCLSLAADILIIDLEDSVAPHVKTLARERAARFLAERSGPGPELLLRINGLETPWGEEDLDAAIAVRPDGIVLPKAESAEMVRIVSQRLDRDGHPASLWLMIETPRAVLDAFSLGNASSRVRGLIMGTSDLVKDLRARHTRDRSSVLMSLSLCVLAARALGLAALDGVHLDLEDEPGFEAACVQGRDLGFDGKTLIHPKTIALANRIFSPSAEEIAYARRVIDAHEAALRDGKGVAVVDGRLVESLHVAEARRLLAIDRRIALPRDGNGQDPPGTTARDVRV